MSSPVISVRGLGKKYRLGETIRHDTLRDKIAHSLKSLFAKKENSEARSAKREAHPNLPPDPQSAIPNCPPIRTPHSALRNPELSPAPQSALHVPQLPSVSPVPRSALRAPHSADFWALKDVSFDVQQGEVVGIIGRNGAGKSTLLKILSQITEPTEGEIRMRGRVASLLEVGTGFHPELTGRENIFLNGAILGMARSEIRKKFDEIVAFAEVEKFIDTPVKRYSSGMYVRLAFAVAAHLEPEILIVDEVLSVGDIAFQKKCLGRMSKVAKEGRTVLFVSHNMEAIRKLCSRGVLLEGGRVLLEGGADKVISRYIQTDTALRTSFQIPPPDEGSGSAVATELVIENVHCARQNGFAVGTPWQVRVSFRIEQPTEHFIVGIGLVNARSIGVWTVWSQPRDIEPGCYEAVFRNDQVVLAADTYSIVVGLSSYQRALHYVEEAGRLVLSEVSENSDALNVSGRAGFVLNPMSIVITSR